MWYEDEPLDQTGTTDVCQDTNLCNSFAKQGDNLIHVNSLNCSEKQMYQEKSLCLSTPQKNEFLYTKIINQSE